MTNDVAIALWKVTPVQSCTQQTLSKYVEMYFEGKEKSFRLWDVEIFNSPISRFYKVTLDHRMKVIDCKRATVMDFLLFLDSKEENHE